MLTTAKPRRPRKPAGIVRELAAKIESLHALAGWSDVTLYYARTQELLAELRAALKKERVTK